MRDFWENFNKKIKLLWIESSKTQKILFFSLLSFVVIVLSVISILSFSTKYVPLYTNLPLQEVNQIKEELDARNIPYELKDGGKTITVPEDKSEQLLVELAGQGIPNSGNIDYSFFSENASWGITDNEFNMMKLAAMETELAKLITSIDGIEDANVMITLPEESVFINDSTEEASAAIILHTKYGHEFKENQIDSLYLLVSKAVPNLPEENIEIRNQYLEYFDKNSSTVFHDEVSQQQTIKKGIEDDIQKRLQQMLGVMVGMDNVVVSVTADVDFTNENRIEELVEPVDVDNMEGIPLSIETIQETYTGAQPEGGIAGTGEVDVANYPGEIEGNDVDYELAKETINFELNLIHRDIIESTYKVRDLGIQVVVNNNLSNVNEEVQLLSQQEQNNVEQGISSILNSMITTSINKDFGEVDPEERISIVFQPFNHQPGIEPQTGPGIPIWMYIVGGILLIAVILLIILLIRQRRGEEESEVEGEPITSSEVEDLELPTQPDSETDIQKKQIEKMAKEKPEEFAKLLRSWITED